MIHFDFLFRCLGDRGMWVLLLLPVGALCELEMEAAALPRRPNSTSLDLFEELLEGSNFNISIPKFEIPIKVEKVASPSFYPVNVSINMVLTYLENIDEIQSQADMVWFIEFSRIDTGVTDKIFSERMVEDDYECLVVPRGEMWTFSGFMFGTNLVKSANQEYADMIVCRDGRIIEGRNARVTVYTEFQVDQFPYDRQVINTSYGHCLGGTKFFRITTQKTNMTEQQKQGFETASTSDFRVEGVECGVVTRHYPGSPIYEYYHSLDCVITVVRQPWHIVLTFCVPCSAITVLLVVAIYLTTLPSERTPKASLFQLSLMTLMSMSVIILAVSDYSPPSNSLSRMQKFFMGVICVDIISPLLGWVFLRVFESERLGKGSRVWRRLATVLHGAVFISLIIVVAALLTIYALN